jgi:hypothetical protein
MKLKNFSWPLDAVSATWACGVLQINKKYILPIRSATVLRDETGVAVVEPRECVGRNNAVVFNADGTERFRVVFPASEPDGYWFEQMYYVRNELTAFANVKGWDKAFVVGNDLAIL